MSEDTTNQSQERDEEAAPDELQLLKDRAITMGVSFHPSIGLEALKVKVRAKMEEPVEQKPAPSIFTPPVPEVEPVKDNTADFSIDDEVDTAPVNETPGARRARKRLEAQELVRVRVQCHNPTKAEWEGEIFAAGNQSVGTITKFVPFNADEGWHIPRILYNMIKSRMYNQFVTTTDARGNKSRKAKLVREFSVEVMDPLTPEELAALALKQAATRSVE